MNKGDYMMLAQAIVTVVGPALKLRKGNVMDRKVLVAIVARKLWNSVEEFAKENESGIMLVLDVDADTFRNHILDLVAEACQLIKEKKGAK